MPGPHQLSLLTVLMRIEGLNPAEQREVVVLLARLLIEATGAARPEATNDDWN